MGKPRLLDLFCGAGGCSMGYHRAGFEVVGVDHRPMPRYPFDFHQGDALEFVREHGHEFDAIHASPPCQAFSPLKALHPHKHDDWPDLVAPTRDLLVASGKPWVMENVIQAPLVSGVMLCGTMFNLRVYRHRQFEASFFMFQPAHPKHEVKVAWRQVKEGFNNGAFVSVTGNRGSYVSSRAMDIHWMSGDEMSQAIPPAYTEWIGDQLLSYLHYQEAA